ncbi:hypothetical protein BGZ74_001272 [Mortierella antarctica]|nr:hypothetical protein BGZ74_001272 [Mortierella antarctica]
MSAIFDIPELVLTIASYLDPRDLARAVRVNKAWHRDMIPLLWHTIDFKDRFAPPPAPPPAPVFSGPDARRALKKYGHHIRIIRSRSFEILEPLVTSAPGCTLLTTLELLDFAEDEFDDWEDIDHATVVVNVQGTQEAGPTTEEGAAGSSTNPEVNDPDQDQNQQEDMQDVNTLVITHDDADVDDVYRSSVTRWKPDRLDLLLTLLHRNPGLEHFVMYDFPSFHEFAIRALLSERLPNLHVLDLGSPASGMVSSRLFALFLEGLSRRVEKMSLTIRTLAEDLTFAPDDPRASLQYGLEEPTLEEEEEEEEQAQDNTTADYGVRTLTIYGDLAQHGVTRALLPFLRHCPELESLTMREYFWASQPQYIEALRRHCPMLQHLCVFLGDASDREIAATLRASRAGWKTLEMSFAVGFGGLSSQAIVQDHAATLTRLNIEGCGRFSSTLLQRLLETAPNLKRLEAVSESSVSHTIDPWLEARDVSAGVDWVCLGLERFRLKIRVPRPEVVVTERYVQTTGSSTTGSTTAAAGGAGEVFDRMPQVSQEECRLLQQEVYRQLGRLVHLRQLWLGNDSDQDYSNAQQYIVQIAEEEKKKLIADSRFQADCLEMTRASGLETLSGLKELESVDISRMACFLELQDVKWMTQAWPQLKTLAGLRADEDLWNDENERWLTGERPDILLDVEFE